MFGGGLLSAAELSSTDSLADKRITADKPTPTGWDVSHKYLQPPNTFSAIRWEVPLWGQLTNNAGEVTLAKSYSPYGAVTQVSGEGRSAYGYTGESQDAASGMVYLRSRYYNAVDGRFQSRDTWEGNEDQPMSYNKWLYGYANPNNTIDPTGHFPCFVLNDRVTVAEKNGIFSSTDYMNTYAAAGLGVQCAGWDRPWLDENQGVGLGQISDRQRETEYGEPVYEYEYDSHGNLVIVYEKNDDGTVKMVNGKPVPVIRGYV